MKVLDPAIRVKIEQLLLAGKKPKAIAAEIGGGTTSEDIYPVANEMRKAGKLAKPTSGPGSNPSPKKISPKHAKKISKKAGKDFQLALSNEINRVEGEIARLKRIAEKYDGTNSNFASHIDTEVEKLEALLADLKELENQ